MNERWHPQILRHNQSETKGDEEKEEYLNSPKPWTPATTPRFIFSTLTVPHRCMFEELANQLSLRIDHRPYASHQTASPYLSNFLPTYTDPCAL